MTLLRAAVLVLLCSIGAAVLLCGWRRRRHRRVLEEDLAAVTMPRTVEDVARRFGM